MPHDAALYADSVKQRSTPAETSDANAAEVAAAQAEYASSARASHSQYNFLTGQADSSAPVLTALVPDTVAVGDPDFTISVQGEKFDVNTVIWWNDHEEPTTFVSENEVTTLVRPDTIGGPAVLPVSVRNGAVFSDSLDFTFTGAQLASVPLPTWSKAEIVDWLLDNGVELSESALGNLNKSELLSLVEAVLSPV